MIKSVNPWDGMGENSERRVDKNFTYDLFWVLDLEGRYGFCIKSKKLLKNDEDIISLKGITVKKVDESGIFSRLYLILNRKEDSEIFLTLCEDLINIANKYDNSEQVIIAVENRLKRWQQLLRNDNYSALTIERQMGLFSEILCLKNNIATEVGIKDAIISWVGPDFDKQDFLIDSAVIEIKSYRTTKGEIVHISSLQQLQSPKTPLYLVAYGLTISDRGLSVSDMIESVIRQIDDEWLLDKFELKLFEYGYIAGLSNKHKLYRFLVDNEKVYQITDKFPRIQRQDIMNQIISVKYAVDLSQCSEFEVSFNNIFKNGGVA